MTERTNKLRNFLGAMLLAYGGSGFALGILLPSLLGEVGRLALLATAVPSALFGMAMLPRTNYRLAKQRSGKRIGMVRVFSDPDDPHRMKRWGVPAGIALALLAVTIIDPPLVHWLQAQGGEHR